MAGSLWCFFRINT